MADPKPLTRKELSQFLPDQRAIRAFEKLFEIVPSEIDTVSSETISADAKATQGVSLSTEALSLARSANVLLWLSI